jgi:hypothetical protein
MNVPATKTLRAQSPCPAADDLHMALFRRRTRTVTSTERIERLFATLDTQEAELTARLDALVDGYADLHAQIERLETGAAPSAVAA